MQIRPRQYPLKTISSYVLAFTGSDKPSRESVLFFHGFPANVGNKNADVASAINLKTGNDVFLLHYRGLGESPGVFSFSESVRESLRVVEDLVRQNKYQKIHIVGHSWGGLVALNAFRQLHERKGRLILLSPFSSFPDRSGIAEVVRAVRAELPEVFGKRSDDEVIADIHRAESEFGPDQFIDQLESKEITVVQASQDSEVPPSLTRTFLSKFRTPPKYVELDQDHSFFRDRDELIRAVLSVF